MSDCSQLALTIRLFGPMEVRLDGAPLPRLRTRKGLWLLALMALRHGSEVERVWLAGQLWPESSEAQGLASLRNSLTDLRHALGGHAERLRSPTVHTLALELTGAEIDVLAFDAATACGDASSLEAAVALYRGLLLEGCVEEWVLPEREAREAAYLTALESLAADAVTRGDLQAAIRHLRGVVAVEPTRETAQRALMQALADSRNHAAAIQVYRDLRRTLHRELNAAPDAATTALFDQIRAEARQKAEGRRQKAEGSDPNASTGANAPSRLPSAFCLLPSGGEAAGGAVPLDSPTYVVRATDAQFHEALARRDSIVLVKGARQMGKTSLLGRGFRQARQAGMRVVLTDLQLLSAAHLASAEAFYRAVGAALADELEVGVFPDQIWAPYLGPSMNFNRYVRRVLGQLSVERSALSVEPDARSIPPQRSTLNAQRSSHLVWGFDSVDVLATCDFGTEVFSLLRSWHNQRVTDPEGPWARLTLVIAYATEAHLFIADANQSPFNVGTQITLADFTPEEVGDLNGRYGSPLRDGAELERFYCLVGGQPDLVRRGLHALSCGDGDIDSVEQETERDAGIFGDHLRRLCAVLARDPALVEAAREVLHGRPCPPGESFYRLRSAGFLTGASARTAQPRCRLYAAYLERHLL